MPPKTITLRDGMSHEVSRGDFLRIRAWLVRGTGTPVEVIAEGAQKVNRPEPSQIYLTDFDNRVALIVRPLGGGEFPPDHLVSLIVEQPTASEHIRLEFPEVRVDGATERVLGEILPSANKKTVTVVAFGSNIAADLPREAMTMVSALRAGGSTTATVKNLAVIVDGSAAMPVTVTEEDLNLIGHVIFGIADHFDLDVAGMESGWEKTSLTSAATRVGAPQSRPRKDAEAVVVVTHAPRPAMALTAVPTIVCVVGENAKIHAELYRSSYGSAYPLAMMVFDHEFTTALATGDHAKLHKSAEIVATILGGQVQQNPFAANTEQRKW